MKPSKRELRSRELACGRIIANFINQKSPERAIEYLNENIRFLPDIPKNLKVKKETSKRIQKCQNDLKKLFEDLICEDHLGDVERITAYVEDYNMVCRPMVDVQEDGTISEYPFFYHERRVEYYSFIAYCLINFLKTNFAEKKKYIAKCGMCEEFFISKKTGVQYCPVCSVKNKMTSEQRATYDKKRREAKKKALTSEEEHRIQHMMKNGGYTRDQAMGFIMEDRENATGKITNEEKRDG